MEILVRPGELCRAGSVRQAGTLFFIARIERRGDLCDRCSAASRQNDRNPCDRTEAISTGTAGTLSIPGKRLTAGTGGKVILTGEITSIGMRRTASGFAGCRAARHPVSSAKFTEPDLRSRQCPKSYCELTRTATATP